MIIVHDIRLYPDQGVVTWVAPWGRGYGEPIARRLAVWLGHLWEKEQHCTVTVYVGQEIPDAAETRA